MPSSITTPTGQTWCLDPGRLRPLVVQFTDHLASLGHTALTVGGYGDAARHFAVWLQQSGIAIAQVDDAMQALDDALLLLCKPGEAYERADDSLKQILNRAIFWRILIQVVDRETEADGVHHEVYTELIRVVHEVDMAPSRPPDAILAGHGARSRQTRPNSASSRTRGSRNEPRHHQQGPGFALRSNGGEGGIRTLGGP